jgi:hypothetical protein
MLKPGLVFVFDLHHVNDLRNAGSENIRISNQVGGALEPVAPDQR